MMLSMGAFRKGTNDYISPKNANKVEKYECPDCRKDVIFRKGSVRIPHFSHMKDDDPCHYYNKPSESQIHKDAKMLLQKTLKTCDKLVVHSKCEGNYCNHSIKSWNVPAFAYVLLEYRFSHNDGFRIADVAYLDDNKNITCIFEIHHTHKTEESDRPEPWYEINTTEFSTYMSKSGNDQIILQCIRKRFCQDCIEIGYKQQIIRMFI